MELYPNKKQMDEYARQWRRDDRWAYRIALVMVR